MFPIKTGATDGKALYRPDLRAIVPLHRQFRGAFYRMMPKHLMRVSIDDNTLQSRERLDLEIHHKLFPLLRPPIAVFQFRSVAPA
jgi:hypothetical protein